MSSNHSYTLKNFKDRQTEELKRYIEAQYHIRNIGLINDRRSLLDQENSIANEPFLETSRFYKSVQGYDSARIGTIASSILSKLAESTSETGVISSPYTHQIDALESFMQNKKNIVVTTGTGSGKTEAFLYPLLSFLIDQEKQATTNQASTKALILYPMNALVADQTARLRKILGSNASIEAIKKEIGRPLRFGSYTGGTPYPGVSSSESNSDSIKHLRDLYKVDAETAEEIDYRDALKASNRVPAKSDIKKFLDQAEKTGDFNSIVDPSDVELIFRGEMQINPPDIMVTNYSMLEYMLLRPIEQAIFDRTKDWLKSNPENQFTIVLDEAHMYTGTTGSEVSLLLRRLISRIGKQDQIRCIVTSASLGDNPEAIREIAHKLTGLREDSFDIIHEQVDEPIKSGTCSEQFARLLGKISPDEIYDIQLKTEYSEISESLKNWVGELSQYLQIQAFSGTISEFKGWLGEHLLKTDVFGLARKTLQGPPKTRSKLAEILFSEQSNRDELLDNLLSLGSIGQTPSSLLLPIRAHFMYRGLPGLYVCANPRCGKDEATVGKMYADKRTICDCGSRVYELYTHRTCGSAYIKGYWSVVEGDDYDQQILHPSGSFNHENLTPVFLYIDDGRPDDDHSIEFFINPRTGLMHKGFSEGYLRTTIPIDENEFKEHIIRDHSSDTKVWTYSKCPHCGEAAVKKDSSQSDSGVFKSSIMDLGTRGEDPFTYLVREQFKLQPPAKAQSDQNPNQGRKVLLFSDGRQKAARIAKALPETIQKDVFRIYVIKAYEWLQTKEAEKKLTGPESEFELKNCSNTLSPLVIYYGLLEVCLRPRKVFFTGEDRRKFTGHLDDYARGRELSLSDPPQPYFQMLTEILCKSYYNLTELAIAGVRPTPSRFKRFLKELEEKNIPTSDSQTLEAFVSKRLRDYLSRGAIKDIEEEYIKEALPDTYDRTGQPATCRLEPKKNAMFSSRKASTLFGKEESKKINLCFVEVFLKKTVVDSERYNLHLSRVALEVNLEGIWYQCSKCLFLTDILAGNDKCPACGGPKETIDFFNQDSPYFMARKLFWRNPVINVLRHDSEELFIEVGEHTAQLNLRDNKEKIIPTVAKNELLFQELIDPSDKDHTQPLDILSSTTTMEVGIDIGGLIAVGMRNVPPQRQNYQQRAGRAGRRGSAFSSVLTFCQNGSHDSHYFKNPEQMISGKLGPIHLEPKNSSLAKRHLLSSLLSTYFNSEGNQQKGRSNDIFDKLGRLEDFLGDTPPCMSDLQRWIKSPTNANLLNSRSEWYLQLFPQSSVVSDIEPMLNTLETKLKDILSERGEKTKENSDDGTLMHVLFDNAYLPSYAFPRDLVEVQIFSSDSKKGITIKEAPSSYIGSAISEYALGRVLVIDKNTYQIGSILGNSVADGRVEDKAASLFDPLACKIYEHCNSCGKLQDGSPEDKDCCETPALNTIKVVQPKHVISRKETRVSINSRDAVFTKANDPQIIGKPLREINKKPKPHGRLTGCKNLTYTASGVRFAHINTNSLSTTTHEPHQLFTVCSLCGKSSPPYAEDVIGNPHDRDYPTRSKKNGVFDYRTCYGTPEKVALGHEMVTDMSAIQFALPEQMKKPTRRELPKELYIACTSLCVAIIQAFTKLQDISERDVGYGIGVAGEDGYDIELYFFDDAQGGADYANKVIPSFYEILKVNPDFNALKILEGCNCDSSCYNCLSSYQNRFVDHRLNRFMGMALAQTLLTGNLEQDGDEQHLLRLAKCLIEEVRQVGGTITGERSFELNRKARSFGFIPSLSERLRLDAEHFLVRPIDVAMDLSNVIEELLND